MAYTKAVILEEIKAALTGTAYYGNALYVARDFPEITQEERRALTALIEMGSGATTQKAFLLSRDLVTKMVGRLTEDGLAAPRPRG